MNKNLTIYLKGFLMGICDLIPGISGGTIAFITGIYEKLINAIKNITPKNYYKLLLSIIKNKKTETKKILKKLDTLFLIILFLGIFSAIILGSKIISFLLENYFAYLITFFIGLILASSKIIYNSIEIHSYKNILFLEIGLFLGFSLLFLTPTNIVNPNSIYLFLGGLFGITALFLPGISGSFILLIMGLYEYIINSVSNITTKFQNLIPFILGAIIGIFTISRIITYLFQKDKSKTLYFLLGLVLGTLIIPIINVFNNIETFNLLLITKLLILLLFGILIVLKFEKK